MSLAHVSLRHFGEAPRPWEAIVADLQALPTWVHEVALTGEDPTDSPHLLKAIAWLSERGRAPMLLTHGQPLGRADRLRTLADKGCRGIGFRFRAGSAAAHDALEGRPGAWDRMVGAMRAAGPLDMLMGVVVDPRLPLAELEPLAVLAASLHAELHLWCVGDDPAGPRLLDAAWKAAGPHRVAVRATAVPDTPPPPGTSPGTADFTLSTLARRGVLPAAARVGVRWRDRPDATDVLAEVRAEDASLLGALGAPVLDLPACEGGVAVGGAPMPPTCAPCARRDGCVGSDPLPGALSRRPPARLRPAPVGARIQVVVPPIPDQVVVLSTFPALVEALRSRGARASLHTAWDLAFDPRDLGALPPEPWRDWLRRSLGRVVGLSSDRAGAYLPPEGLLRHPLIGDESDARRHAATEALWERLDLRGADVVVTPDLASARRALDRPDLPDHATVIAADFHMLEGADLLDARGARHPRLAIHSCFPGYAHLYPARGVPLADVHWRPYPMHLGHFRAAETRAVAFCGGRHLRDTATLVAAAGALGDLHPLEVITDPDPALRPVGPLRLRPACPLPEFVAAVVSSRFLVLPMIPDPSHAAGITVLSMAHAAGRPVVATATRAMSDHVRDGVDGLLVPAHDADALAHAVRRLATDPSLWERLSQGAREAGARLSVERWADTILWGADPPRMPRAQR